MTDRQHRARVRRLAEEIVVDLFVNGMGSRADRLVLFAEPKGGEVKNLGGLCPEAARDRIEAILLGRNPPQNAGAPPVPTPEEFFGATQSARFRQRRRGH